jgi:hypothetical protein
MGSPREQLPWMALTGIMVLTNIDKTHVVMMQFAKNFNFPEGPYAREQALEHIGYALQSRLLPGTGIAH